MGDLKAWQPLYRQPAISRDLSLAVEPGLGIEDITEHVLQVAGYRASWIEELRIRGCWSFEELPSLTVKRLGIVRGQHNLVLQVVLRPVPGHPRGPSSRGARWRLSGRRALVKPCNG